MHKQRFLCTATVSFLLPSTSSLCYFPNGNVSNGLACHPTAEASVCCGDGVACLSNGVCEHLSDSSSSSVAATYYTRGTCTDSSWKSASCPQFCQKENPDGVMLLSNCTTDGIWCCGTNDGSCCENTGSLVNLGNGRPETTLGFVAFSTSTAGPSASSSLQDTATSTENTQPTISPSSIIATTTSSSSTAATPTTSTTSTNTTAVKVGAGVGIPLGLLLAGALAYMLFLRRKHARDRNDSLQRQISKRDNKGPSEGQQPLTPLVSRCEIDGSTRHEGSELPGQREPAELGGYGRTQLSNVVAQ